jgi:hypothetical protein
MLLARFYRFISPRATAMCAVRRSARDFYGSMFVVSLLDVSSDPSRQTTIARFEAKADIRMQIADWFSDKKLQRPGRAALAVPIRRALSNFLRRKRIIFAFDMRPRRPNT